MKQLKLSAHNAWNGIKYVFKSERNFRIHCFIACVVLIFGYFLGWEVWKYVIVLIVIGQMLAIEIVNSAIEYTWDHLEPNHHPVVGVIKDVIAGAVLVSALAAVVIGVLLFIF